jgi:arylsulfatase A-like enzyme
MYRYVLYWLVANLFLVAPVSAQVQTPPNILFIIMDDVGIDQMNSFGYGGLTAATTPNIDAIARKGIRFRNHWSMPACSPSRATFFNGRYPMRSNLMGALGPSDLANSMVTPYDYTVPKILKNRSYQSALFGKFHMGLQGNNPFGIGMVGSLGFDYFLGWLDETGDPSSIDTTAGGVGGPNGNGKSYGCGFVPGTKDGGADTGACYAADGSCSVMTLSNPIYPPGRQCRDQGGIFNPNGQCPSQGQSMPPNIAEAFTNSSNYNAHYVSPLDQLQNGVTTALPMTDKKARTYRGTVPVDAALAWVNAQPQGTPWMATVSFATDHTPLVQPPVPLLPAGSIDTNGFNCAEAMNSLEANSIVVIQTLSNQMITAMDHEIGRLLVGLGLAHQNPDGTIIYAPEQTNTMIVLVGDNGSLGNTVKQPFDPTRAKGTSYQTGVWVPLLVAGPEVVVSNRDVSAMTNHADLFALFGSIAGLDVSTMVPWQIDAQAMMPYIKNPNQPPIRSWNFNQNGPNLQADGSVNGPCMMAGNTSCSQIPVTKGVCNDNGGVWWGPGAVPSDDSTKPVPQQYCCQVLNYMQQNGIQAGTALTDVNIYPLGSIGIRNSNYKLVENSVKAYNPTSTAASKTSDNCLDTVTHELYLIDESVPLPRLDRSTNALLNQTTTSDAGSTVDLSGLNAVSKSNYLALNKKLQDLQNSVVSCPGDGNLDGIVNQTDVEQWTRYSQIGSEGSSWYDFNLDGLTNNADLQVILANFGRTCKAPPPPVQIPSILRPE